MNSMRPLFGSLLLFLAPAGCGEATGRAPSRPDSVAEEIAGLPGVVRFDDLGVEVLTDLGRDEAARVARRAVAARRAFERVVAVRDRGVPPARFVWIADRPLARHVRSLCGSADGDAAPAEPAAFHSRRHSLVLLSPLVDARSPWMVDRVVAHETVHAEVARAGFDPVAGRGAWFAEGLPGLFECLDAEGAAFDVADSELVAQARGLVLAGSAPAAREFLDADRSGFEAHGTTMVHYAWRGMSRVQAVPKGYALAGAWAAFVAEVTGEGFGEFARAALGSGAGADAVARALGCGVSALDGRFEAWAGRSGGRARKERR